MVNNQYFETNDTSYFEGTTTLTFNEPISDFNGLEYFVDLETLILDSDNASSDGRKLAYHFVDQSGEHYSSVNADTVFGNMPNLKAIIVEDGNTFIAISAANFPDSQFRSGISSLSYSNNRLNNYLLPDSITSISMYNQSISDISGIEYFTALKTVSFENNNISDPEPLYGLILLNSINLNKNALTSFDATNFPDLVTLNIRNCQLTSFVCDHMDRLTTLDVSGNPLKNIDLSGCTMLMNR